MSSSDVQLRRKIEELFPIPSFIATMGLNFFFCNMSSLVCLTKLKVPYIYLFFVFFQKHAFLYYWLAA